jgi:hypothetical protein
LRAQTAAEEAVYEVVLRQAALVDELQGRRAREAGRRRWWEEEEEGSELGWGLLGDAYDRCGEFCAEFAKTFYLGELRPLSHLSNCVSSHFATSKILYLLSLPSAPRIIIDGSRDGLCSQPSS